ncbi:hypothetical protein PIB30_071893 [Stylosanthes scabra]|uniref:Uncharacterized protein n=1 Tax=Stylosanthes scabra TaxID=79078 RepID=A0ABU6YMT1_9FABA|nr:hypothetical protein [Stylosanthes scabra]
MKHMMPEILSDSRTPTGKCTGSYQVIKVAPIPELDGGLVTHDDEGHGRGEKRRRNHD